MARWTPIHISKPKPGQLVLYYGPQAGLGLAQYMENSGAYYFQVGGWHVAFPVTHWQELPKPPRSATKRIL